MYYITVRDIVYKRRGGLEYLQSFFTKLTGITVA